MRGLANTDCGTWIKWGREIYAGSFILAICPDCAAEFWYPAYHREKGIAGVSFVSNCSTTELEQSGFADDESFLAYVKEDASGTALKLLAEAITTHHTFFS